MKRGIEFHLLTHIWFEFRWINIFLESLRKQLGDVDIARKVAADQAEENKNLARDIQDVYEEKLAKVGFQNEFP